MKENRNPNIKKQTLHRKCAFTLSLQCFVFVLMIILGIGYLFFKNFFSFLIFSIVSFLCLGAYNSYRYLGKKKMSILYILVSLFLLLQLVLK